MSRTLFSLAGFQVITIGRFWVITEGLLFREAKLGLRVSAREFIGWILIGGGLFNFVEGWIDHDLLGIHHVHPFSHWLAWDSGFLLVGGLLPIGIGWLLKRETQQVAVQLRRSA